ncbi:MAG: T9SS C-terminal target domain-containing protein [Chitinophagia bacterium]|nr:T9SS C-terminal target domain-containing protein [Chitinophagia bacterium]
MIMKTNNLARLLAVVLVFFAFAADAQEHAGALLYRGVTTSKKNDVVNHKTTALGLPFFDDFSTSDFYPAPYLWVEKQVYINNTMGVHPPTIGVATFDALNENGLPWDPVNPTNHRHCDSLTSQSIDLSGRTAADSLYLSFYYQPQGNGYYPSIPDSLFLYMKIRYGDWLPVWKVKGRSLTPFQRVMIPITDTLYFHNNFQFRFVNIAALNFADANWNIDYVYLNRGRNQNDTLLNDVAMLSTPSPLLNDYISMPYRQFMANPAAERATNLLDSVINNTTNTQSTVSYFTAYHPASGTVLLAPSSRTDTINSRTAKQTTYRSYTTTIPMAGRYDKVTYQHKCYIESNAGTGFIGNDTARLTQVFDNYLAYDDGSAEQSYYLTLYPSLPGKLAIEHHLNIPDTMRGMSIYFGRQAPLSLSKTFALCIWKSLAGVNGATTDELIYQSDLCTPGYKDTLNNFWNYGLDTAVPLPAGTFYAGIFLPAESGNDSLYLGLDINRRGGNHAYYNVLSSWSPSALHGAIMMRPLLGQRVVSSDIEAIENKQVFNLYPNPCQESLTLNGAFEGSIQYWVSNLLGQQVLSGNTHSGATTINVTTLLPGNYILHVKPEGKEQIVKIFSKQ